MLCVTDDKNIPILGPYGSCPVVHSEMGAQSNGFRTRGLRLYPPGLRIPLHPDVERLLYP
jgi:hypothetical protein